MKFCGVLSKFTADCDISSPLTEQLIEGYHYVGAVVGVLHFMRMNRYKLK